MPTTDPAELVKRLRYMAVVSIPEWSGVINEAAAHIERTAAQPGLEDVTEHRDELAMQLYESQERIARLLDLVKDNLLTTNGNSHYCNGWADAMDFVLRHAPASPEPADSGETGDSRCPSCKSPMTTAKGPQRFWDCGSQTDDEDDRFYQSEECQARRAINLDPAAPCERCAELEAELELSRKLKSIVESSESRLQATVTRLEGELAEAKARINVIEEDMGTAALTLQDALPIGKVKAIGLREVPKGVEMLAAQHAAAVQRAEEAERRWNCLRESIGNQRECAEKSSDLEVSVYRPPVLASIQGEMSKLEGNAPAEQPDVPPKPPMLLAKCGDDPWRWWLRGNGDSVHPNWRTNEAPVGVAYACGADCFTEVDRDASDSLALKALDADLAQQGDDQ